MVTMQVAPRIVRWLCGPIFCGESIKCLRLKEVQRDCWCPRDVRSNKALHTLNDKVDTVLSYHYDMSCLYKINKKTSGRITQKNYEKIAFFVFAHKL